MKVTGAATETQSSGGTSSPAIYYINSGWERHFYGQELQHWSCCLIGNDISSGLHYKWNIIIQMGYILFKLVHLDSSDVKTDLVSDVDMAWVASNGGLAEYVLRMTLISIYIKRRG